MTLALKRLQGYSSESGVIIREKDAVTALVEVIDTFARSGRVDPNHAAIGMLEALDNCKPYHWAAYAEHARVAPPSYAIIEAVKDVFRKRIETYPQY